MQNELLTTAEVRNMVAPWLTGNEAKDAASLRRTFRMLGFSIAQWRQVVRETRAAQ